MTSNPFRRCPFLAAGLILTLGLSACGQDQQAAPAQTIVDALPVRTETVEVAPLMLIVALTGSVEAGRIAQLASPMEGPVTCCVRVREGDLVSKGQVLLVLGHTEGADAQVASLREDLKQEEDNLVRTRRLVETGALAGEQLDIVAAKVTRVRAQLIKALESTQDYVITAPWDGVVSKMRVHDGDFVSPHAPLAEIYDPRSLIVRIAAPEQEAAHLALDMRTTVELDAYPGERFNARITRLYPYLDSRTHTRIAEITLSDPPTLLPGMFARIYLVKETLANAITVPAYSLIATPDGQAIFVAQDGKAQRRKVETGVEVDGRVRIVSGLAAGDQLIVGGQQMLKDGAPVRAVEVDGKKVEAAKAAPAGTTQTNTGQP